MSATQVKKTASAKQGSTYETIKTIFVAAIIALAIRSVVFEPFSIPSGSMVPSLLIGDYLFVSKGSYGYSRYSFPLGIAPIEGRIMAKPVQRGDVIVFAKPHNENIDYIKRVMGLPGDRLQMKNGRLYINGTMLKREYVGDYDFKLPDGEVVRHKRYKEILPEGREHMIIERWDNGTLDDTPEYTVPEAHYFMMGDNRDGSQDSRVMEDVGFVPAINLIGRAKRIFFSLEEGTPAWAVWKWPKAIRYDRLGAEII